MLLTKSNISINNLNQEGKRFSFLLVFSFPKNNSFSWRVSFPRNENNASSTFFKQQRLLVIMCQYQFLWNFVQCVLTNPREKGEKVRKVSQKVILPASLMFIVCQFSLGKEYRMKRKIRSLTTGHNQNDCPAIDISTNTQHWTSRRWYACLCIFGFELLYDILNSELPRVLCILILQMIRLYPMRNHGSLIKFIPRRIHQNTNL